MENIFFLCVLIVFVSEYLDELKEIDIFYIYMNYGFIN